MADVIRLSQVDESNRADHGRLVAEDTCLYLYEYTSGQNYSFSSTNNLISNLKKEPSQRHRPGYHYKQRAIQRCAADLAAAINPAWLDVATLVPVPGSKAVDHPDYDDRMERVCRAIRPGLDVRNLVKQTASTAASHKAGDGPWVTVEELLAVYEVDESIALPPPRTIGIMDDVLTAGTHFRAMDTVLRQRFPGVPITGIFIARRVFPTAADDFDILA